MTPWHFTLLGYKAGFAQPAFLLAELLVLTLGALAIFVSSRRKARLQKAVPLRQAAALTPGVSTTLPMLQSSSYTVALLFFVLALAQPQCGERAEVAKRRGIDVVVALDASKSMYTRDVTPSRLERAKLELSSLLDSLKGDRVGLVVFAGDAFIQCPLTSDYSAAKLFLRAVDPEAMPQGGTNIGAALLLARQVLENADRGAKDRVVVLLSDGEDLTQDVSQGIDALKELGARVLAIGIGSEAGEPIPLLNKAGEMVGYQKDENGVTVISHLDQAALTHIATATGGKYFSQPRGVAMNEVVEIIDSLQKSEQENRITMRYGEVYQPFLAIGLFWLVLGLFLVPSWRKRAPLFSAILVVGLHSNAGWAAGPLERNHPQVDEGTEAYEAQRFDEALTHYDAAVKERPQDAKAHYDRALALHKLGRHDEAKTAFQTALDLDKTHELAGKIHYNLGNVAAAAGDDKRAVQEYRAALTQNPQDAAARHNLEVLLRKLPPKAPPSPDGGTPDGGSPDGGSPDGGRDGGSPDAGKPDGGADGGADGGTPDGGGPDGGPGDAGAGGDGGSADGGPADGGAPKGEEPGDGGRDGGADAADGGSPQPQEPRRLPDGGVDVSQQDAEKLLDSLKNSEKNFQLWRFKQKNKRNEPHGKDW